MSVEIKKKKELTAEDYRIIIENSFASLFVTDGAGNIIYVNSGTVEVLGCAEEELLLMNVYELRERGYTSVSTTNEVLKQKKQVMRTYMNIRGEEVVAVSTPVFDHNDEIYMVVTYSKAITNLNEFNFELDVERKKSRKYRDILDYMENKDFLNNDIVARDSQMVYILNTLKNIAKTDSSIMLYGESGVGKEVVANFIRQNSNRNDGIFIPINCAAIPSELIESELFGYEKGAFTGAHQNGKMGIFELANGGTVFLDELGEMPLMAQGKLLRVLENGEFRRIGSSQNLRTNVRIIGATNRNLKQMMEERTFREDLYYRLNVIPITIPPLRKRPADLEVLVETFLSDFNRKHNKLCVIPEYAMEGIRQYSWPGNIRELRNVVERFVITGDSNMLLMNGKRASTEEKQDVQEEKAEPEKASAACRSGSLKEVVDAAEKSYIEEVMVQCGGKVSEAADILGIHRSILYKKIKKASCGKTICDLHSPSKGNLF